jgi:hypothetical protein
MDLTTLTDEELDALQLAVNTEIGQRLAQKRAADRLASAMVSAASSGFTPEQVETVVVEARGRAKIPYAAPVVEATAPVSSIPRRTRPKTRRIRTIEPNTIS